MNMMRFNGLGLNHAAAVRDLPAGAIIGSGTVAHADYAHVDLGCISERRALEIIAHGRPLRAMTFRSCGGYVSIVKERHNA